MQRVKEKELLLNTYYMLVSVQGSCSSLNSHKPRRRSDYPCGRGGNGLERANSFSKIPHPGSHALGVTCVARPVWRLEAEMRIRFLPSRSSQSHGGGRQPTAHRRLTGRTLSKLDV